MTAGLPLKKNVITPLSKNVFITLELTAAASPTDAVTQKEIFGLGTTAMIISNEKWMISRK